MRTVRALSTLLVITAPMIATPGTVMAQEKTPLSQLLVKLYSDEIAENLAAFPSLDRNAALSDLADAFVMTAAMGNQLATFPLGSSAGGFSWTFNPSVGSFTRSTGSFGPIFAERGLTVGRHRLNLGVNFQRATYDHFEDKSLEDGEVVFYTALNSNVIARDALFLELTTNTVGIFANYGITDRWDVGMALPIINAKMDATLRFQVLDATGARHPQFSNIDIPKSDEGSKTGIGDIVLRTKFKAVDLKGGGIAAAIDARLPTGDEDNLLGNPGYQVKVFGIASWVAGIVSPHVNLGYTFSHDNDIVKDENSVFLPIPEEFNYAVGADVAVTPRLTLAGDIIGRTLRDVPHLTFGDVGLGPNFHEFDLDDDTRNESLVLGSIGAKFNVRGNLLLALNVLTPLTKNGLTDKFTPVIGFDYSF